KTVYAYDVPQYFFDPMLDRFRFAGYGRTVELVGAGTPKGIPGPTATITDRFRFDDGSVPPPACDPMDRYGRFLRAGLPQFITTLAGDLGSDASALLSVNAQGDLNRIAQTRYTFGTRFFIEASGANVFDCMEFIDPYNYASSALLSAFDSCTSHGFTYPT